LRMQTKMSKGRFELLDSLQRSRLTCVRNYAAIRQISPGLMTLNDKYWYTDTFLKDICPKNTYPKDISPSPKQGRRQKIFQGGPTKKRQKISKKYRKIALFSLFQGGATEKRPTPAPHCRRPWLQIDSGHPLLE